MPIRVNCQCGQSLNVPDAMAGKSGKCPKCQQLIKIPGSPAAASPGSKPPSAKPASASPAPGGSKAAGKPGAASAKPAPAPVATAMAPAFPQNNLDSLFDAAGLTQRTGNFCPSCDAPVQPGAVLCVKCGLNFAEGTVHEAHKVQAKRQFGNKQLNHAAEMMVREAETEKRLLGAGAPWWFMFAALAGLVVFIGGALIKMDAITTGKVSGNPFMARIQNADMLTVLIASAGLACILISNFAQLAILINAFYESAKQGLLSMFVPFYILYYMFSRMRERKLTSTVIILWVTAILGTIGVAYSFPKI